MTDEKKLTIEERIELSEELGGMVIRVLKTIAGEEIVTAIEGVRQKNGSDELMYQCLDPAFPAAHPERPGAFVFMPWMMFASDRMFNIKRSDLVVDPKTVDPEIALQYKQYFMKGMDVKGEEESNIIIPSKPNIVT